MSQWHREHPELIGTDADPWMDLPSYREAMRTTPRICGGCLRETSDLNYRNLCRRCRYVDEWDNA